MLPSLAISHWTASCCDRTSDTHEIQNSSSAIAVVKSVCLNRPNPLYLYNIERGSWVEIGWEREGGYWGGGGGKILPSKIFLQTCWKRPGVGLVIWGTSSMVSGIHAGSETSYRSGAGVSIDQRNVGHNMHKGLLNRVHPRTSGSHLNALKTYIINWQIWIDGSLGLILRWL